MSEASRGSGPEAALPRVTLIPLSDEEREAFIAEDLSDWADQQVRDHGWSPGEAPERAREELLPVLRSEHESAATMGDRQWAAFGVDGKSVGWLWVRRPSEGMPADSAFLYQISVRRPLRRRGYGRAMLAALEALLPEEGIEELRLNVMGANRPAMRLYEFSGYELAVELDGKRQLRKPLREQAR